MSDFCCHVLVRDPATGDVMEVFHTHVDVPMAELAAPLVLREAARRNLDLTGAVAVTMEFIQPLDTRTLEDYEGVRRSVHADKPAQAPSPDPQAGPGAALH